MRDYKIKIEWFPFWQLLGLAAFNVIVLAACFIGLILLVGAAVR